MSANRQINASDNDVEKEIFLSDGRTYRMVPEQENTKKTNNLCAGKDNLTMKKFLCIQQQQLPLVEWAI